MKTNNLSLRIPVDLDEKFDALAVKTGKLKADLLRDALRLGLDDLGLVKKTDFERLKEEVVAAKAKGDAQAKPPQRGGNCQAASIGRVSPGPVKRKSRTGTR
jgi:predicted DNA-binding protein